MQLKYTHNINSKKKKTFNTQININLKDIHSAEYYIWY